MVDGPHVDYGEELITFIVLRDGTTVGERNLVTNCLEYIARFNHRKAYRFLPAWLAISIFAVLFAASPSNADQTATILNRAFVGSTGAGVDLAITTVSIDSVPVTEEKPQVQVSAGVRAIEVLCSTHVFAGMGRVDLNFKTTVTVNLEAGRVYQLDAEVTEQGDCTPQLKLQ